MAEEVYKRSTPVDVVPKTGVCWCGIAGAKVGKEKGGGAGINYMLSFTIFKGQESDVGLDFPSWFCFRYGSIGKKNETKSFRVLSKILDIAGILPVNQNVTISWYMEEGNQQKIVAGCNKGECYVGLKIKVKDGMVEVLDAYTKEEYKAKADKESFVRETGSDSQSVSEPKEATGGGDW